MAIRMSLTKNEIEKKLDKKIIGAEFKSFSFPHGKNEVREINKTLRYILTGNIRIDIIANDITKKTFMSIVTIKMHMLLFNEE